MEANQYRHTLVMTGKLESTSEPAGFSRAEFQEHYWMKKWKNIYKKHQKWNFQKNTIACG
jgi:hypothetical protein